jgi:hypothetical protein
MTNTRSSIRSPANSRLPRLFAASVLLLASVPMLSMAQTSPPMGQAASFAVLGGSAVTNTGATSVLGELGVSPGTAVTGFPPGTVTGGSIHINDAVAQQAQSDLTIAYNALAGQAPTAELTDQDLGGLTLGPGVYRFTSSAQLTGTLTLDAQGDPAAVFIFQIGSTLTTASAANVVMINGGSDCNVYWQVGSSATLGTGSALAGSILALTSITLTTSASVSGRVLARNGAVTLDTSAVAVCAAGCPPVTLAPTTLPNATVGAAYTQTLVASGGTAPYAYTVSAGALPPGLSLSGAGQLSGNPTAAGSYTFTVTATDAAGCIVTRVYTLVVGPQGCPVLTVAPTTLPAGIIGAPYSQTITASGGTAPYVYSVTTGALAPSLTLTPTGLLSGIPNLLGNFSFTVTAIDAAGCPGSRAYVVPVGPPACPLVTVLPATLPVATIGAPYSQALTASGGTAPYTFSVTAGSLPPALTLTPTGLVSGIPGVLGNFSFTVTAVDAAGCPGSRAYVVPVGPPACPLLTVLPESLPVATIGVPYSQAISASGGTAPYTFSVTTGALPPSLALAPTGLLTGIPNLLGNFSFTITAVDAAGCPGSRTYVIPVGPPACPLISVLPATLPAGVVGTPYSQAITATGGTAPYLFTVTTGAPPTGLTLFPGGALSGTPSAVGTFAFTVTATDAASCPGSRPYSIAITAGGPGPGPGPTPTVRNVPALSAWALGLLVLMTIVLVGVGRRTG